MRVFGEKYERKHNKGQVKWGNERKHKMLSLILLPIPHPHGDGGGGDMRENIIHEGWGGKEI